jgi:hypothetical protein
MKKGIKNKNDEEIVELIQNKIWNNYKTIFSKINYIKKNSLSYYTSLMFLISYLLYFFSLEKCMDGFDICGTKNTWIIIKSIEAILSSLILSILIEGMIFKIISKIHFIHIFLIYICFFIYSHGIDFHDHGFFNILGCFALIIILLLVLTPLTLILYLIIVKKNKFYILIFASFLLIFFPLIKKISSTHMNCDDWARGLNNTIIENDINKYSCIITFPKFCPYKIGKYIFDFSKIKGKKCEEMKQDTKANLLSISKSNYINESTKRIGLPLTNKEPSLFLWKNYISDYFQSHLVDMDNIHLTKKVFNKSNYPEMIIDYTSNKYGELKIDLNFNASLSQERSLLEKDSSPYSKNIMMLYIDSVSRAYSVRKLKKTLTFFEQFISYQGYSNPNYPDENYHSFQFLKYHSFNSYTRYNYPKIFYGNIGDKSMLRITKYLKENGYITCFINDMCLREPTRIEHDMSFEEISDHEMLVCDPNMSHVNSNLIRCLYNKISTAHLYEYGDQFWRKYQNNRKFLAIMSNDGHEGTLEILKYIDDIIFNFLDKLFKDNLFKDSTIFLLSDHGTSIPSPYYINKFFMMEKHLPMLYMICSDRKNISYKEQYEYINKNQQIIITGYDIYNTLGYLIYGDKYSLIQNKTEDKDTAKSQFGRSLFNEIDYKRSPKNYTNMNINICK